jgi:hypothetical protein
MSHYTRVKTRIREREGLVQALRDLHYTFQLGENLPVRGYFGAGEKAEVVVDTGSKFDIGFVRKTDAYEAVADWSPMWGVEKHTRIREATFIQQLNQRYAYNTVLAYAEERDYVREEEPGEVAGEVVFILTERG